MDIGKLLAGLKGHVLDIKDIELLKHAYELQEENIRQLKTNNEAIRENASLVKQQLTHAESRNDELAAENARLKDSVAELKDTADRQFEPDEIDIAILKCLSREDGQRVPDSRVDRELRQPRTIVEYHLSRLKSQKYISRFSSLQRGTETVNFIDHKGRKHLIDNGLV